ncbi:MAG: lytic transglycosylase domain-containing protein [Xanthobacter sp.]
MLPVPSLISASILAMSVALGGAVSAASAATPLPPHKPSNLRAGGAVASASGNLAVFPTPRSAVMTTGSVRTSQQPLPALTSSSSLPRGELSTLQSAVKSARNSRGTEALSTASQLRDPVARTLVEWLVIRHAPNDMGFDNINAFLKANPGWPTQSTLRRRAERVLFQENRGADRTLAFFTQQPPLSGEGKLALARALLAKGNSKDASAWARSAWREDSLTESFEKTALSEFGRAFTRDDHKARASRFSYARDSGRAMRAASLAGSDVVALTRAQLAAVNASSNAASLLGKVPYGLRSEPAYLFAQAQILRRADKGKEAARALLAGADSADAKANPDDWWVERRRLARNLVDHRDPRTAYQVAATGVAPESDNYRAEQQFTAGWIALRFMNDPRTASAHFARIAHGQKHPIALGRAYYWQGRAAEAMGNTMSARSHYQTAANYSWTYYGQMARLRLGAKPVSLRATPSASFSDKQTFARLEPVKAIRMLYAIDERNIPLTIYYDLAWRLEDPSHIALLSDLAEANDDPRGALAVGKEAMGEGHPVESDAYPTFGMPRYTPIGDPVDKAAVYAIARQESHFNPNTYSSAKAMGLMQVTPAAGRQVSKITGVPYSEKRLRTDMSYNVQFGAAELGELVRVYDGNYVLAFAAYNAGRGNVSDWIKMYGDPRDPNVDVVDWVELIPFSETRNYVQRVMENYQSYKARFNLSNTRQMEADLRGDMRR